MIDRVIKAITEEQSLTEKWIAQIEQEIAHTIEQTALLRQTLKEARAEAQWHSVIKDAVLKANDKLKG